MMYSGRAKHFWPKGTEGTPILTKKVHGKNEIYPFRTFFGHKGVSKMQINEKPGF